MSVLFVEVMNAAKTGWDQVSTYDADLIYNSGRHSPPKSMTGRQIADEDRKIFVKNYGRAVRIREAT